MILSCFTKCLKELYGVCLPYRARDLALDHSYLSDSAGFAEAARIVWKFMVISPISRVKPAARINIQTWIPDW